MCLLVKQPAGHSFSDEWLADFFDSNPDGIGIMWAEDNTLYHIKHLPSTVQDMIAFYRQWADKKECAIHWRWRTHGDTDLANCHPYEVFSADEGYPLYLMHNGVLQTGNAADTTKSDTWHYINDYIRPALKGRGHEFMSDWFKAFVEDHIGGSNKFVMMDAFGNVQTFNESAGVMWEGCWMSNTYAWSADKAGLKSRWAWNGGIGNRLGSNLGRKSVFDYDDYDAYDHFSESGQGGTPAVPRLTAPGVTVPKKAGSGETSVQELRDNEDAALYSDLFFEEIYNAGWECYYAITVDEVTELFEEDPVEAWKLLELITDGEIYNDELLAYFDARAQGNLFEPEDEDDDNPVTPGHLKVGMQ
jgi:hypothetical protein